MTRRLVFFDEFSQDLVFQHAWYEARSVGLGIAFVREADKAVGRVQDMPESCVEVRDGFRRKRLLRFPFSVVYRLKADAIEFVGVIHGAQDFGSWLLRRTVAAE